MGVNQIHSGGLHSSEGGGSIPIKIAVRECVGSGDWFLYVLIRPSGQWDASIELAWLDDAPLAPLPG